MAATAASLTLAYQLSPEPSDIDLKWTLSCEIDNKLSTYVKEGPEDRTVQVINAFACSLPVDGLQNLKDDVENRTDQGLRDLCQRLITAILYPLKTRPKTPVASAPTPDAAFNVETIAGELGPPETRNAQSGLRKSALQRDGGRCIVTRILDKGEARAQDSKEKPTVMTVGAHILPFSLGGEREIGEREQIWEALYRYFPSIRTAEQNFRINKLSNMLTLWIEVHDDFGSFRLALEPYGDNENEYYIKTYKNYSSIMDPFLPPDCLRIFRGHDGRHEMPNRHLLRLHAAVAKILYLTGMGEEIDELLRDRESIRYLARDGSTDVARFLMMVM